MNRAAEHDLARLRASLDYPRQTSVPDVGAIMARGRRQRARRQAVGIGATVTAVAAVVALAAGALTAGPPGLRPAPELLAALPGGPPPPVLVSSGAPRAEAPERFDPLTRTLKLGWVPEGLDGGGVTIGPRKQTYGAFDDAYVNGGPDIGLVVIVLARGQSVEEFPDGALGLPREREGRRTDPVNGGTAECLSDIRVPEGTCSALRWEYAPDAWAQVSYAGSAGPTSEAAAAVARRVAESLSLTAAEPVRLPFTLTGRLAGLRPVSTSIALADDVDPISGTRWDATVDLAVAGADDQPVVSVGASLEPGDPSGRLDDKDGPPTMTLDGHEARLSEDSLLVWGVQGTRLWIWGRSVSVQSYDDVEMLDDPTDPMGWVPLR